jgi:AraC family transcriptional regulator
VLQLRVEPDFDLAERRHAAYAHLGVHHHAAPSLSLIFQGWHEERLGRQLYRCDPLSVTYKRGGIDHSNHIGCDGLHGVFVELSSDTVAQLESPNTRRDFLLIASRRSRRLVRYIARESALQTPGFELALSSLLAELLAEVSRFAAPHSFGQPSWLERAREYVEAHSSMQITLAELARHSGVHPVHLAQAFRSRYGMSVGAYVRRLRVERARQELATGRLPISQVALSAGFTDQSHFTRVFRMHAGTTPGRFRKAARLARAVTLHANPVQDRGGGSP